MNDSEFTPPVVGAGVGADASTAADRVARWRAEVEAFAARINAELQELMHRTGQQPATAPQDREPPVERLHVPMAPTAPTASAAAMTATAAAPTAPTAAVAADTPAATEDDGETRLRALREQFAAKLRRFDTEGTTLETLAALPSERGANEHQ